MMKNRRTPFTMKTVASSSPVSSIVNPPRVRDRIRFPLAIPIQPYLKDHHFYGKIILPAGEILQRLAGSLQSYRPDAPIRYMHSASFDRFLLIDRDSSIIDAWHELEVYENGRLSSRLTTTELITGTTIKRTKVHAVVDFTEPGEADAPLPMDIASTLEGICREIPAQELYRDLVPFGPAYQNIKGILFLSENGAVCRVLGAEHPAISDPLGSPFPFDAALHAACAWGQRFHDIVAFPVGFAKRSVEKPTVPGELYHCRILPVSSTGEALRFDLWIYDLDGNLREEIRGVMMKDVSGGRVRPPDWVLCQGTVPLANILKHCRALSIIDGKTIADFAVKALSLPERERFEKMGKKRQRSYLSARLALKQLSRKLSGMDRTTPASDIHTMMPDGIHPSCPVPVSKAPLFCSVSHDPRFSIAVASNEKIGVDVEKVSDRVLKHRYIFMGEEEMALTEISPLGVIPASIRVWSIKEGISKATDRHLAESWKTVKVDDIGWSRSHLTVNGTRYTAFHDTVDDHIVTLVKKEK